MAELLSPEELLALEEQLAQQEAPVQAPYQSAPSGPEVLPPGPSPEFLRRQLMTSRMQPGTGMITGPNGTWTVVGAPPPSVQAQLMEQMRQQLNNTEYKTQAEANAAALQFQRMRAFQKLSESGMSPEKAFMSAMDPTTKGFAQTYNALRPAPAPALTNLGGVQVVTSGLKGERATIVPTAKTVEPKVSIKTDPLTGDDVITWSGSAAEFKKAFPNAKMPGAEEPQPNPKVPIPMPKTKAELKKGTLYATPRGLATWNGEKFIIQ